MELKLTRRSRIEKWAFLIPAILFQLSWGWYPLVVAFFLSLTDARPRGPISFTGLQSYQRVWNDPLTAQAVQSADGKAAYVQLNLAGSQGEVLSNQSVDAVRNIIAKTPPPDGLKVFLTGTTPMATDLAYTGDHAAMKITAVTVVVISIMLLLVYRSITTVILVMMMMGIGVLRKYPCASC